MKCLTCNECKDKEICAKANGFDKAPYPLVSYFKKLCKEPETLKYIEELEKENAELKKKLESDELALNEADEIIAELKEKYEALSLNTETRIKGCNDEIYRLKAQRLEIKNLCIERSKELTEAKLEIKNLELANIEARKTIQKLNEKFNNNAFHSI